MGKNNNYNKNNNQKKDYSTFYITIIICLIILLWTGMSLDGSRYRSLKSLYDWESGKNFELQQRIDELELQIDELELQFDPENFNISLELAKEQGKRESLSFAYNHIIEALFDKCFLSEN